MPTTTLIRTDSTVIIFTHPSEYSAQTNGVIGTRTHDIDVDEGVTTGLAEESIKVDLGVNHAEAYEVMCTFQMEDDITAGGTLDFYWSNSHSATAAVGNLATASGASGAFAARNGLTLAELLNQLIYVGSAQVGINNDGDTNDGLQIAPVGTFIPGAQRYGSMIMHNNTSVTMEDAVEFAIRMKPVEPEFQDA